MPSNIEKISAGNARHRMIAEAAYYRAEHRGFAPGLALDDWTAAQHEIDVACKLVEPHRSWDTGIDDSALDV